LLLRSSATRDEPEFVTKVPRYVNSSMWIQAAWALFAASSENFRKRANARAAYFVASGMYSGAVGEAATAPTVA
jgi:hypothetical protein